MVQYKEAKNPAGVTETVLDEPTGSYRERIATQARPGRGRWSMVGYAACAVLVLSTLVMGVNSIGSYEKINELQEAVSLIAGNFTQNEAKQAKDNDKTIVTTVDGKAKDGENSENKQDVAQNDKKESQNAGESSEQSSEEVQETAAQPQSEAEKILAQGYYIVQSGDSLESISTKIYGNKSRVERIKESNQIENADTIFAGQKLNLP